MGRKIEKVIIKLEGIDVILSMNGVNSITQIDLNVDSKIIKEIFQKYNLSDIINYEFDEKIVRALALDEEGTQLREYLEICKQVHSGNKRIKLAENMPKIEYDLRGLKEYDD